MTNSIRKTLEIQNFISLNNTYILQTGVSTFTFYQEEYINERYTKMDYLIQTEIGSFSGSINTNQFDTFLNSFQRLLVLFEEYVQKSEKFNQMQSFITYSLEKIGFENNKNGIQTLTYSSKASFQTTLKEKFLGFNLVKTSKGFNTELEEFYFNENISKNDISDVINHVKDIIQKDIHKNKVIPFVS